MSDIATIISSIGFPCVSAIALFFGCRYLLESMQKNYDRMFEMYDKSNTENREAIKANTEALNSLCKMLDNLKE